ncbi:MAG: aldolase [Betaproteobacteria bacterium]|nr:aldolase [Betaproteobacteria bacterium]
MKESDLREQIALIGNSLYDRGFAHGSAGNISVKLGDGWLMTPTNSSLGRLDPARISRLDANGKFLSGDKPSKETFLHITMYRERASAGAVVHLHSVHAVAISCLADVDPNDVFPPITAYAIMQLGRIALVPYYTPGDETLANAVGKLAAKHHAVLLANHGPVVAGATLDAAVNAIEELEQTAKLVLLLRGQPTRLLTAAQVATLNQRFPS